MDNLTHSLFGLTLARTPLGRAGRGTTAALLLASNVPDADIVVTLGGAAKYLEFHRGPTHGPLGIAGLAVVVAGLVWGGVRRWRKPDAGPDASFTHLWLISMLGILGHVLMDLPTSYGTRPLSPFTWTWFTTDWMPIVDIYLLAILAGGLWLGRQAPGAARWRRSARVATVTLLLMSAHYGLRATLHDAAVQRAPEAFGPRLPAWCADAVPQGTPAHWPRGGGENPGTAAPGACVVDLAALPDFLSPFRWRLIAQLRNAYEIRDVDLWSGRGLNPDESLATRVLSVRVPNQWTPAVATASRAPTAQVFLGFSRFPAASSVMGEDGTMVRWSDLRFIQGSLDDPRQFRRGLFGATVLLGSDGTVEEDRLGP